MISKGRALAALDGEPGRWFCIRCWAEALGAGDGAYADLRDIVQSLATGRSAGVYDMVHNEIRHIVCDIQGARCEKKLTGAAAYSGWRWSIRRKPA